MVPQHSQGPEKVLYVTASPRREHSRSILLADAFLEAYGSRREIEIDRLDAFHDLPPFAGREAEAKMAVIAREDVPTRSAAAWDEVLEVCERVLAADLLVFAVPMWNGGIPWALKLFVDIVTQPGIAFSFDPEAGYRGLLAGRRAVSVYTSRIYARGVAPEFGVDNQSSYLAWWLDYCGIELVEEIRFQPTFPTPDLEQREAAARAEARSAGFALANSTQPVSP